MRRLILILVFSSLAACTCSPAQPQRVTIPPTALPVLTSGVLAFPTLNDDVLAPIGSNVNNALLFSQEFEKAPGMTTMSLPVASVAAVEGLIPNTVPIPPLERDFVMCAAKEFPDGGEAPFPTQPYYESPSVLFVKPDGGLSFSGAVAGSFGFVQLDHVRGAVTSLSLVPDSPSTGTTQLLVDGRTGVTSFMPSATLGGLDVKATVVGQPVTLRATSVTLTCAGVIAPATTNVPTRYLSCGEQNVRCVAPTVTIDGFSTNISVPLVSEIAEGQLKQALLDAMAAGINLHFQNFAPTSFSFVPGTSGQLLTLTGSSTVVNGWSPCSPVPPTEPPLGPTRALGRVSATWGKALQTSSTGRVRFIDLIPEAEMWLDTNHPQTFELIHRGALQPGPTTGFVEAPPLDQPVGGPGSPGFLPYGLSTQLRTVRQTKEACWVEPLKYETLEVLQSGRVFAQWNGVDGKKAQEGLPWLGKGSMGVLAIEEVDFDNELTPLVKQLGVDGTEGLQWARVTIGVATPLDGPFDPWAPTGVIELYTELPLPELMEHFKPQVICSGEFQEPVEKEERVSDPEVDFGAFKLDSADLVATLLPTNDLRNTYRRRVSGDHVIISLPVTCPVVAAYSPYVSCWKEKFDKLPNAGSIAVTSGFSGTTQRTGSLRTELPEALGDRTAAVHGVFDRSSVALYTKVPDDYLGFTAQTWDYRGVITFDWAHVSSFAPAHSNRPGYLVSAHRYFTNWQTERFELRHEGQWPPSNCLLPEMRYAVPTELVITEFNGVTFGARRVETKTPGELSLNGAGAFGDYRVSPGVSRSFATVSLAP